MGFVWTDPTITANTTKAKAVHVNELHSNIDTVRVSLGMAKYSWTNTTVTANSDKIKGVDFSESVTALDELYDNPLCTANYAIPHFSSDNATHKNAVNVKYYNPNLTTPHYSKNKVGNYSTDKAIPHYSKYYSSN